MSDTCLYWQNMAYGCAWEALSLWAWWDTRGKVISTWTHFSSMTLPGGCNYGGALPVALGCKATTDGKSLSFSRHPPGFTRFHCTLWWNLKSAAIAAWWVWEAILEVVADNWWRDGCVIPVIDYVIPVQLHSTNEEISYRGLLEGLNRAMWRVKGLFPSLQTHLQSVSKIHAAWDYVEKGGMAIIEVRESCCMVCSLLPKTVADAELKADEP